MRKERLWMKSPLKTSKIFLELPRFDGEFRTVHLQQKLTALKNYRLMHSLNFLPYGTSFPSTPILKRQSSSIYRHERSARRTIGRAKWRGVQELLRVGATGPRGPHGRELSERRPDTLRWQVETPLP